MTETSTPEIVLEYPTNEDLSPAQARIPNRKSNPAIPSALRLWSSLHHLNSILATLSATRTPADGQPLRSPGQGIPDMLHRSTPLNQAAFHEWVEASYLRVFR